MVEICFVLASAAGANPAIAMVSRAVNTGEFNLFNMASLM
jgi:uncharacterized membrane protein